MVLLFRIDFQFPDFFPRNGYATSGENDPTPTDVSRGLGNRGSAQPGCVGRVGEQRNQRPPELFVAGTAPVSGVLYSRKARSIFRGATMGGW